MTTAPSTAPPPLVSFCLDRGSSSWPTLERAAHVGVHLLGEGQHDVARTFATSGIDRFAAHTDWRYGPYNVPLLDSPAAWLLCRVTQRLAAGDHAIVLAEPLHGQYARGAVPLIYHMGQYASVTPPPPSPASSPPVGQQAA